MLTEPWHVRMFGGLEARSGEQSVTKFTTQKTATLFAYLARNLDRSLTRDYLSEMFWPDSEPEAKRTNLRVALNVLRRLFEPVGVPQGSVILADRYTIRLNPELVTTDVALFETVLRPVPDAGSSAREQMLARAVEVYSGEFLPGFSDDWVETERDRLAEMFGQALRDLAGALRESGDLAKALEYAHRAVVANPHEEGTHIDLIRLYTMAGRTMDAVRQYEEMERRLDDAGEAPSVQAMQMAEEISLSPTRRKNARRLRRTDARRRQGDRAADVMPAPQPEIVLMSERASAPPAAPVSPSASRGRVAGMPIQLTRFFGRQGDLASLGNMLSEPETRLVTIAGPGGCGKTRLSVEYVTRRDEFAVPACFVALADTEDASVVPSVVLHALGADEDPRRPVVEQIVDAIGGKPWLLVLDNFEQVAEDAAAFIGELLVAAPSVRLIVTSRHRLDISGEQVLPLRPLPVPPRQASPEVMMQYASVQLFVDRAQKVQPAFQITSKQAEHVAAVCACLEGLPLAIELAASWAHALNPAQMTSRLANRFELLVNRKKDAPARQQTLHAALEWSYRLLPQELRRFFAAMSVFRGGWTLESAAAVWGEPDCLDMIQGLLSRSLALAEDFGDEMRYSMLETLREYAAAKQAESAWADPSEPHCRFFTSLAEEAEPGLVGPGQAVWFERLGREHDNLRTAIRWSGPNKHDYAIRLGAALWRFWYVRGHVREGRSLLEGVLGSDAQLGAGSVEARALNGAGVLARAAGDLQLAERHLTRALAARRDLGDWVGAAGTLNNLGMLYRDQGRIQEARSAYQDCLDAATALDDPLLTATATGNLGAIAIEARDFGQAQDMLRRALASHRRRKDTWSEAATLHNLSEVVYQTDDTTAAARWGRQAAALWLELHDAGQAARTLRHLWYVERDLGQYDRAAVLAGAVAALSDGLSDHADHEEATMDDDGFDALRSALGHAMFEDAFETGRRLSLEDAVALAVQDNLRPLRV